MGGAEHPLYYFGGCGAHPLIPTSDALALTPLPAFHLVPTYRRVEWLVMVEELAQELEHFGLVLLHQADDLEGPLVGSRGLQ